MSVDQQEQQDEVCPSCRKAIRKRSKGSFTAWIFQDSICRCLPGADSIEDAVVAASADLPAQSAGNARKRSLLGESTPVILPQVQQPQLLPQPTAQESAQYPLPQPTAQESVQYPLPQPTAQQSVQYVPQPTPQPTPHTAAQQAPQAFAQAAPQRVTHGTSQSQSSLIIFRDLVSASISAVLLYAGFKVSGNNEHVVLGLVGSIVVVTLVVLGIRFVRK